MEGFLRKQPIPPISNHRSDAQRETPTDNATQTSPMTKIGAKNAGPHVIREHKPRENRMALARPAVMSLSAPDMRRSFFLLITAGFTLLATLGLTAQARAEQITVFAAASLKTALDAVAATYSEDTGRNLTLSYAGSSALARQIDLGAPADLFISAHPQWMDMLERDEKIIAETRTPLLGNNLVLIAPAEVPPPNAEDLNDLAAYLAGRKIAMGMVNAVPAGIYGKAALEHLGQWNALAPHVAQTDNVRAALALVALQQAALGVVYGSDAQAEPRVQVLLRLSAESHPKITYPAAVIAGAHEQAARDFLTWLTQNTAQQIFAKHGFTQAEVAQ